MKLSTKGRYGLRAMVDLAVNSNGDNVALNSIAERQNVSASYLEQVFSTLRKSGIVRSVKGSQGGYMLAANPANITVGDILRSLEGDLSVIDCDSKSNTGTDSIEYSLEINVWGKINEAINVVVDSITLEDIVNEYRRLNGNLPLMYYI